MNQIISKVFLFLSLISYFFSYGQGTIQSIVPNQALQGQSVQIVIKGSATTFQTGGVSVDLGAGIQILNIDVKNSLTLYVSVEILPTAFSGFRDLRIISNGETLELLNAFQVIDKDANEVFAILEINPVQVLYASDFDPDNLEAAPLVLQVTVINDQQTRNLKTFFYLILESEGLILTAIKEHGEVPPAASITFDNREFDEFDVNEENTGITDQIFTTGMLPPGTYTYKIEVREGSKILTSVEAQNTLLNQAGDLVIISPGSPAADGPPINQFAAQPLFQWISTANQFDLFLYEVPEGQSNVQEIVQQLPVYREFSIPGNTFLYPLSAEQLEEGQTYAWQLRAYFNNPSGDGFFDSPLWWFTYDPSGGFDVQVGSIEIVPEFLEMDTKGRMQFNAVITDLEGNILTLKPTWTVLPDQGFGTIDTSGYFMAGQHPGIGAVQASYGGVSTHCIVDMKFAGFSYNILDLIRYGKRGVHKSKN